VRSAFDLAQDFAEAEAEGQRRDIVQRLTQVDLLVIEDLGMKRLGPTAAEDLLEIFVRRHEAASTLITTNRLCGAPHNKFRTKPLRGRRSRDRPSVSRTAGSSRRSLILILT
jgi:DNA replication protein DnaC